MNRSNLNIRKHDVRFYCRPALRQVYLLTLQSRLKNFASMTAIEAKLDEPKLHAHQAFKTSSQAA